MNEKAREHLRRARAGLIISQPFYATAVMELPLREDLSIPTMSTDGRSIAYNPQFSLELPLKHARAVLAHEALHCVFLHFARRQGRDLMRWNIATDYAINALLIQAGLELPDGCLHDRRYAGMTPEVIYSMLPENPPQPKGWNVGGVNDGPKDDGDGDGGGNGGGDLITRWVIVGQQALASARMQGKTPAGIDRMIGDLISPRIDPAALIEEFIEHCACNDYSFTRINKRLSRGGLVFPGMRSEALPPLVLVNDTSGSRGDRELREFAGMLSGILSRWQCEITVLHVDSAVARVEEFTTQDLPLDLHPAGGGGTDFAPAFDWVRDSGREYAGMLYFTDLYGDFPDYAPDYPVIWVCDTGLDNVPFGRVVNL